MTIQNTMTRLGTGLHAKLVKMTGALGGGTDDGSVLVLTHKGAKSGTVRDTPLMFVNHENGHVIMASMAGSDNNPAWYHNLKANPDTTINVANQDIPVHARELDGDEREKYWKKFVASGDRWEQYAAKTDRTMPLIHLEPR